MKKLFLLSLLICGIVKMVDSQVPNGVYVIHSALDYNYVIDLNGSRIQDGNNIQLWEYNGTDAQKWVVENVGSLTIIRSAINRNYVMDLSSANTNDGNNIQLWKYNGTNAQCWRIVTNKDGYSAIVVDLSPDGNLHVVDLDHSIVRRGQNIQIWGSNRTSAQWWWFELVK